jgi:SdrD B-like domain/SprB repeat
MNLGNNSPFNLIQDYLIHKFLPMQSMFYKIETKLFSLLLAFLLSNSLFAQLQVSVINTNLSCFSICNGSATATVTGGTTPYSYKWGGLQTSATITGLCANSYTVTVTDANGATSVASTSITQPSQLLVQAYGTDQICGINPAGTATATPSGGTPAYAYTWNTGATTAGITGLTAGTYTVTATDAKGCTHAASANVIFSNEGIWLMELVADVTCAGQNDGSLTVSPMTGSAPYIYMWSNGGNTKTISGLAPGTYSVTVNEAGGCSAVRSFTINQPQPVTLAVTPTNAVCGGTGTASAFAGGGNGGYTYNWSNGATGANISGLVAGTYTVTATDSKGCATAKSVVVLGGNGSVSVSASVATQPGCNSNGTITASGSGGSGSFTYAWSNGVNTASNSVGAGTYIVTVTDNAGCASTASVTVQAPTVPVASATVVSNATCSTGGSATASVQSAGTHTYMWDNGQTSATATNLSSGPHTVTVTNAAGCTTTATITISQPASTLAATATATAQPNCNTTGSASVAASGGKTPYSYLWSGGQTTAAVTGLAAGTFTITVTDGDGCTKVSQVTLTQPTSTLAATAAATTSPKCNTLGSATVSVTGGKSPYTYLWTGGQTTAVAAGLAAGTFTVTVTDGDGCSKTTSVTLTAQANTLTATSGTTTNPTCVTQGSASVTAANGKTPYSYLWSGGQTTASINNLIAGTYTVTVTDGDGCSKTTSVTLTGPSSQPAVAISSSSNASCTAGGNAVAAATSGLAPYTYAWSNGTTGATASGLAAGTYTVTATDANGCTKTTTVTIGFTSNGTQIGDYVWQDSDQDGLQEVGELAASNIYVMLMRAGPDGVFGTADDVTIARDTTDTNGLYLFDCVLPGTYVLMFSNLPAGFQWTAKDNVTNDCKDSDVNSGGKTSPFTIVAGAANNLCFDAGYHTACSNVSSPGTIGNDQTICEGQTPATLFTVGAPIGGTGVLEYVWMRLDKSGTTPTWVGIPNTNTETYNPGPLFQTQHFMRCVRRAGCITFLETNVVTITVKPMGSPGCTTFLTSFVIGAAANQGISVEWTVPYELPQTSYKVQHSKDMLKWSDIHSKAGQLDGSPTPLTYKYMHTIPQMGDNYYRIVRINNGAETVSDERKLNVQMDALTVYPNPSLGASKVFMRNNMAFTDELTVQVFDLNGRLINTILMPVGQTGDVELSTLSLSAGFYYMQVLRNGQPIQTTELLRY